MTPFDRPLYGFRFVEILRGDTLRAIAARELGNASRWYDIIAYNDLVHPYLTDDPAQVKPGVLLSGAMLLVPAPAPIVTTTTDPDQVFERDMRLGGGVLDVENGDFAVAAGRENFRQAIKHRVDTHRGDLINHLEYGNYTHRLLGAVNGPTTALLAAQYSKSAVEADPRVRQVTASSAEVIGDVVNVSVSAEPVSGRAVEQLSTTI